MKFLLFLRPSDVGLWRARCLDQETSRFTREQGTLHTLFVILGLIAAARAALRAFSQENILVPMHPHFGSIASETITLVDLPACLI